MSENENTLNPIIEFLEASVIPDCKIVQGIGTSTGVYTEEDITLHTELLKSTREALRILKEDRK